MTSRFQATIIAIGIVASSLPCRANAPALLDKEVEREQNLAVPALKPLFRMTDKAWKEIPEKQRLLFERAQRDLDLVASGKPPVAYRLKTITFDGGTTTFECEDYDVTLWKGMLRLNDVLFLKRGISIAFKSPFLGAYPPGDVVANTWLEPLSLR